jgi:hypothetical protein
MGKTWADAADRPDIGASLMAGRGDPSLGRDDRRRSAGRRVAVRRRRALALLLLAASAIVLVLVAASLARGDDAFSGVWWEPASGRRVEIVRDGDAYRLLYGAQRRPFAAERRGDELVIAAPLGGDIVVRAVAADRLELEDGGRTTTLQPAPDGS